MPLELFYQSWAAGRLSILDVHMGSCSTRPLTRESYKTGGSEHIDVEEARCTWLSQQGRPWSCHDGPSADFSTASPSSQGPLAPPAPQCDSQHWKRSTHQRENGRTRRRSPMMQTLGAAAMDWTRQCTVLGSMLGKIVVLP
eukprot:2400224-Amphidinium_carterae.1